MIGVWLKRDNVAYRFFEPFRDFNGKGLKSENFDLQNVPIFNEILEKKQKRPVHFAANSSS